MLLTVRTEGYDFLRVLAATRREVRILLETDEPLRKPRPRQSARLRAVSAHAREQLVAQLGRARRRPFRGRVAVRLDVTLPGAHADLGLRRVVKEHVDLLHGLVFADDAVVDHVEAHLTTREGGPALAELRCLPLAAFCDDFDRAFRLWDEIRRSVPERGWGRNFDEHDRSILSYEEGILDLIADLDEQEEQQLAEGPAADVDLDLPTGVCEFGDRQVRASTRQHLADSAARSRGVWLCDQGLDSRDRPGPAPAWRHEAHTLDAADIVVLPDTGPGCFMLPAPPRRPRAPGERTWQWHIERQMSSQLSRDHMFSVRFGGPLALDIAFQGGCADHADVDNLAHTLIAALEMTMNRAAPKVGGYRAYRQDGGAPSVRVRLLPHERLLALGAAMERARTLVRAERAARARAAA